MFWVGGVDVFGSNLGADVKVGVPAVERMIIPGNLMSFNGFIPGGAMVSAGKDLNGVSRGNPN